MKILVLAGVQCLLLCVPQAFCQVVSNRVVQRHQELYEETHRARYLCGRNALYGLLLMRGKNVAHAAVVEALGRYTDYPGYSLKQLRQAAETLGLHCSVRFSTREELEANRNLPVVAHLNDTLSGGLETGHFVIVSELTKDRVQFFDPVMLIWREKSPEAFLDRWSGYVLQPTDTDWLPRCTTALVAIGFLAILALLGREWMGQAAELSSSRRISKCISVLFLVATTWLSEGAADAANADYTGVWRDSFHDSTNICYVLLSLRGIKPSYREIESQLARDSQGSSLKSLKAICANYGVQADVLQACPEDLRRLTLPVVLHMSERVEHGGVLALMISRGTKGVLVMQGDTGIIDYLTWDSLRRSWSGYAVVPRADCFRIKQLILSAAIAVVVVILVALGREYWWKRQSTTSGTQGSSAASEM